MARRHNGDGADHFSSIDGSPEWLFGLAPMIHEHFEAHFGRGPVRPWSSLSSEDRVQCLSQAADIPRKLSSTGRVIVPSATEWAFTDDEIEFLAAGEHRRWMLTEQLAVGSGNKLERSDGRTEWDDLDELEKEKDREAVRVIPLLLASAARGAALRPMAVRVGLITDPRFTTPSAALMALTHARARCLEKIGDPADRVGFELVLMDFPGDASDLAFTAELLELAAADGAWRYAHLVSDQSAAPFERVAGVTRGIERTTLCLVELERTESPHWTTWLEVVRRRQEVMPTDHASVAVDVHTDRSTAWRRLGEEITNQSDITLFACAPSVLLPRLRKAKPTDRFRPPLRPVRHYARDRGFKTALHRANGHPVWRRIWRTDFEAYARKSQLASAIPTVLDPEPRSPWPASTEAYFDPIIERTDRLAAKYKGRYFRLGVAVLVLAAFAVSLFAFRVVVRPEWHDLLWFEIGCAASAAALQLWSGAASLSMKWLTFRGLAERYRSAKFLALAGHTDPSHPKARTARGTQPWVADEAWRVWDDWLGRSDETAQHVDAATSARYLHTHWIKAQLDHHRARAAVREGRARWLRRGIRVGFVATLTLLLIHATSIVHGDAETAVEIAAFSIPVWLGVWVGIGEQRGWREYGARSWRTARELEDVDERLRNRLADRERPLDREDLSTLARDTDRAIRHDLREWYWSMELSEIRAE